jgi:hypothetical protein
MKKNILLILFIFMFSNIFANSFGTALWNLFLGSPQRVSLKNVEDYIKDRITVKFYNRFGRMPNKTELEDLCEKAASKIYLNEDQIEKLEKEVGSIVEIHIGHYEYINDYPPHYFQSPVAKHQKITLNQLPEYVSDYIKKKYNFYYNPGDIPGYSQMLDHIIIRAKQEAFAGYTNDGQQIVDELIWQDKLNTIIEEECYSLDYYVEPSAPAWDE